ncbi:Putative arsenical resistance operon repressor ArsR [Candidatus Bilamarchaeum dharawalense]|uniref:Arsenical resistance operon repressor ArsR n=1 Tax=Candidatus Bilamarchaeum dharawalense TaxID=2885759 RepID=A0A5E4LL68_9ARCH|nr:Putative arsenical resistance operon repressor ArsR [Candidatus Bilamarchaeum dharawalense]
MNTVKLFKALGDSTRFKLVKILIRGERCACELPRMVGKAQPTTSLQLKKLVSAGVLSCKKDGVKSIYKISNQKIAKLLKLVG